MENWKRKLAKLTNKKPSNSIKKTGKENQWLIVNYWWQI